MKDPVIQAGSALLRERAAPVGKKDIGSPALRKLIVHMKRVLAKEEYGVALAAPQVGSSLRVFIIADKAFKKGEEAPAEEFAPAPRSNRGRSHPQTPPAAAASRVFINPEITKLSRKKREMSEGCLSVRGKYGTV